MRNKTVKNRSEIVFLYDIKDTNPNGDPDENRPRIDEETSINLVTDVRLKRTIRDYLANYKSKEIFIIEEKREDETQKSRTRRLAEFIIKIKEKDNSKFENWDVDTNTLNKMNDTEIEKEIKNKISIKELEELLLELYLDIRLFGATIAVKESTITKIGPVQFKFGRSLHKVEDKRIPGTTVLPSREGVKQGTFTEIYMLPYSLICFYGIINENAAKSTNLTEDDVKDLLEGIWNGTKNLITRSKVGQVPRLLLRVIYKENNFHIGDLDKKIRLLDNDNKEIDKDGISGKKIRNISDIKIDITKLLNTLDSHKEKIEKVECKVNEDVVFTVSSSDFRGSDIEKELKKITRVEKLNFKE